MPSSDLLQSCCEANEAKVGAHFPCASVTGHTDYLAPQACNEPVSRKFGSTVPELPEPPRSRSQQAVAEFKNVFEKTNLYQIHCKIKSQRLTKPPPTQQECHLQDQNAPCKKKSMRLSHTHIPLNNKYNVVGTNENTERQRVRENEDTACNVEAATPASLFLFQGRAFGKYPTCSSGFTAHPG